MASKFQDANGFVIDKFLDSFGREFCKHEVLWKPIPNWRDYQILSYKAYRKIAEVLKVSTKIILELTDIFPEACVDLMSRYEKCRRTDARCHLPDWLVTIAHHIRPLNKFMRKKKAAVVTTREDLVRALCASAHVGVAGEGEGVGARVSPLLAPRAVTAFAARHYVREGDVLPVWHSVYKMCVVKLHAQLAAGDRVAMMSDLLLLDPDEREITDLALLHDPDVKQITFLTPAKLRSLVLLFQLIVAAKEEYDREHPQKRDDERNEDIIPNSLDLENSNINEKSNSDESISLCPNIEVRSDENVNSTSTISVYKEPLGTTNSDKIADTTSSSKDLNSTIEDLSQKSIHRSNIQNLLPEKVIERKLRRETIDISEATPVESLDYKLHTELDLEPDINVISSDTSDNEISNKSLEEYSISNIKDSILRNRNQTTGSGDDITEDYDERFAEKESEIGSRSKGSKKTSPYPKTYWYKESKSRSSEEQRVVWALVYTDFIKRGRPASLVSLQHRWVELLHRARATLLTAWSCETHTDRNVHPLLLVVAYRFPEIVTEHLPPWKRLVLERKIVLESDIKDIINKYENNNALLKITENIADQDLVKEYVSNDDLNDVLCQSKSDATYKNLSYQINNENPSDVIKNIDKVMMPATQAPDSEVNVSSCITTMLEQIDPSKAKVSIIFDEESDEDDDDVETKPELNSFHVLQSDQEKTNQIPYAFDKSDKLVEITMDNIEVLQDKLDDMNNSVDILVKSIHDKETSINDFAIQDDLGLLKLKEVHFEEVDYIEHKPLIDVKLVNKPYVVITPIDHLYEWKKLSRNGVIRCRSFSVKKFTKPVKINSKQLSKCRPYLNTNKDTFNMEDNYEIESENDSENFESENYLKNDVRIKFEDDSFEADFCSGDDVNNGIIYQKYIELYSMPDHMRKSRKKLTRKLKLSRTYFSSKFWSLDSNVELMKLCKPMDIKLSKVLPRVAKRVELTDIDEVRRINRSILTAQVSPRPLDTTHTDVQSTAASQALDSTTNSISSSTDTAKQTNSSVSYVCNSSKLRKLLTDYTIDDTKAKKSSEENITKNGYSNFMDSVIDNMRLQDKNHSSHSTLMCSLISQEQGPPSNSQPVDLLMDTCDTSTTNNIPATDTLNTNQQSNEEVLTIPKLNVVNNSIDASTSPIHISSDSTKELCVKNQLKTKVSKATNTDLELTKLINVADLKDMILNLIKNFDTDIRHEYNDDMKMNRSSLNVHLKKFEKQQRDLVKDIARLVKKLPEYVISLKPKKKNTNNETPANKQDKNSLIELEQAKDNFKSVSDKTDNVSNVANNENSVLVDDDCEPTLVIDERSLQPSENIEVNNIIVMNKNIIDTSNKRRNDKKEKIRLKAKKRPKQTKKPAEEAAPVLNEYQEWQRQKTMALKYFTIPTSDTSKLITKDKITPQQSTTTEQQSNGCQTIIPIKRKNTEDLTNITTASDIGKCRKLPADNEVIYVADGSSDDDLRITKSNIPSVHANTPQNQTNQNVYVMNAPFATIIQPLCLVLSGSHIPAQNALNQTQEPEATDNLQNGPVFSHAASYPTEIKIVPQTQIQPNQMVLNEQVILNMLPSQNSLRDQVVTCALNETQNAATSQDSRNN